MHSVKIGSTAPWVIAGVYDIQQTARKKKS